MKHSFQESNGPSTSLEKEEFDINDEEADQGQSLGVEETPLLQKPLTAREWRSLLLDLYYEKSGLAKLSREKPSTAHFGNWGNEYG